MLSFKSYTELKEGKYPVWLKFVTGGLVLKVRGLSNQIQNETDPVKQNKLISKQNNLLSYIVGFDINNSFVVRTERSLFTTSQTIVNMFQGWYKKLGLLGCLSHSGRRTFITKTSKKISLVGGSLRDIQMMVGHSSLQTTQRYIESDSESQRKVVDLL